MTTSQSKPILCPRCTADTQLDARDPRNPKRICACGWSVSAAEIEQAARTVAAAMALRAMDPDDDMGQPARYVPAAPVAQRGIGAESVPALLEQVREMAEVVEDAKNDAYVEALVSETVISTLAEALRQRGRSDVLPGGEIAGAVIEAWDEARADASEGRRLLRLLVDAGWENTTAGLRTAVLRWMGGE